MEKVNILIVEDSRTQALQLKYMLESEGYTLRVAENGAEALSLIDRDFFPDLIISDIVMPNINGIELCKIVKEKYPGIFIILQTSSQEETLLRESFENGAVDFISKPIKEMELSVRIKNVLRIRNAENLLKKMLDQVTEANKELKKLSITDPLTGIYNRCHAFDELNNQLFTSERYGRQFCVLIMDLDHFKKTNDTYGHIVGDVVLIRFAETLQANIRKTDILGRYGGEEFIVIFPMTTLDGAIQISMKLLELVREIKIDSYPDLKVTMSGGICEYRKDDSLETILSRSDALMYKAKENGRNRIEY